MTGKHHAAAARTPSAKGKGRPAGDHHAEKFARLRAYLERHKLKSTKQRDVIAGIFFGEHGHVDIESLHARIKEQDPGIGFATVYRTMKLLTDSGLAQERRFADGRTRYEVHDEDGHHDHLICLDCGSIVEFVNDDIEALQDKVAAQHKFEILNHRMEIYGRCESCQVKARPAKRASA